MDLDASLRDTLIEKYIGDPAGRRKLLQSMRLPLQLRIDFREAKKRPRHPVDSLGGLIDTFRRIENLMGEDERQSAEYQAVAALVTRWLGPTP